jgi:hypothetical protein
VYCCCIAIAASSTATRGARAGEDDARDLFAQARELRLQGRCASAVPLFQRAYTAYPAGLGSLRNIAECEEQLGRSASARHAWLDLGRALVTGHPSKYEGWDVDAAEAATRLAAKVATLTVEVRAATPSGGPASASGVDVRLGDQVLSPASVGQPLEVDPGHYVVRAGTEGAGGVTERSVDLLAGDAKRVELAVVVPATPEQPATVRHAFAPRTAVWIAAGAGVASLVAAAVAGMARQSALDDLVTECGSTTACPRAQGDPAETAKVRAIEDRGHSAATWSSVFAIAGAVGIATGVLLFVTAPSHPSSTSLWISPSGIYAVGRY